MCWGNNSNGQLGDGTTTDSILPVAVNGLESVKSISAGINHTCAILDNGSAMCWGYNYSGQLGDGSSGTTDNNSYPVAVNGLESAESISAGLNYTCAVLDNKSAKCWGDNTNGKLGNGFSSGTYSTPNAVSGLGAVKTLSAGRIHTCAVLDNGSAMCWGNNSNGQLGDGTTTQSTSPVAVSGLPRLTQSVLVATSTAHTPAQCLITVLQNVGGLILMDNWGMEALEPTIPLQATSLISTIFGCMESTIH